MGFYTIWHHINSSLLLMLKFRSFTLSILTHLGTTVYAIRKKKMIHTQCNTLGMSLSHSRIFSYLIVVEVTMTTINFSPRHQSHSDVSKTCHDKCRLPIGSFLTIANVPFVYGVTNETAQQSKLGTSYLRFQIKIWKLTQGLNSLSLSFRYCTNCESHKCNFQSQQKI